MAVELESARPRADIQYSTTATSFRIMPADTGDVNAYPLKEEVASLYKDYVAMEGAIPFEFVERAMRAAIRTFRHLALWTSMQRSNTSLTKYGVKFINETINYIYGINNGRAIETVCWYPLLFNSRHDSDLATPEERKSIPEIKHMSTRLCFSTWLSRDGGLGDMVTTLAIVLDVTEWHEGYREWRNT